MQNSAMRPVHRLLLSMARSSTQYALRDPAMQSIQLQLTRDFQQHRRYVQRVDEIEREEATPLRSMREFFMHPLTWDRNNGFLNVVLAIAVFGLCFINSCSPCPEDIPPQQSKKDEN